MSENFNDVADAFDGWMQEITGTRQTGSYVSGRWVEGSGQAISFDGVVQNATPDDLQVLPEGNRADEAIKIHTTFNLVVQSGSTTNGDMISYGGKDWLVFNVADRKIGGYFKAIAIKA